MITRSNLEVKQKNQVQNVSQTKGAFEKLEQSSWVLGQEQLLPYDSLGCRISTSFLLYSQNLRGNRVIQGAPKFHCFQVLVSQEETYA